MLSKIRTKNLESNIWKFYLYRIFSCLIFVSPIIILFYQENGLNMTQIMILQAVYTAVTLLAVVPSGIIADYIGRKKVLIANAIFFVSGWAMYALSHNFWHFLITEIIIALSAATWMASGTAFFYDTLKELSKEKSFKKLYGNVITINYIFWGLSSLFASYIAAISMRLTFWLTVIATFIALLITFSFTDTKKYKHGDKHYLTHLKCALNFTVTHPRVRLFIVYSSIIYSVGFLGYILYQPYLQSIKVPLVYFGFIYFLIFMAAAFGSKIANKAEQFLGEKKILTGIIVFTALSFFFMSKELVFIGIIFPIILSSCSGLLEPVIPYYVNKHVSSHHRSTIMSLHTLLVNLLSTIMAPFFGWIVDFWSLSTAFLAASIILGIDILILILGFYLIKKYN